MNLNHFFPSKETTKTNGLNGEFEKVFMISPSHFRFVSFCVFHFLEGPLFICMLYFIFPKLWKKTAIVITSIQKNI